jgi:antitoxin ParD1/3/4
MRRSSKDYFFDENLSAGPGRVQRGVGVEKWTNNCYWFCQREPVEPAMPVSADLGVKLEKYVVKLVKSGRYNSKSEVIREGLRLLQDKERQFELDLQRKIQAGLESARAGRLVSIDEVERKVMARVRAAVRKAKSTRAA